MPTRKSADSFIRKDYSSIPPFRRHSAYQRALMKELPPLDAHAHIEPSRTTKELADSGFVLAMTLSLEQAALVVDRKDPNSV